MTIATFWYFLAASVALTVAPGPDNIFVVAQGLFRGRKTAIITALGMCSGISIHTVAAAFGISAIFYSSVVAFNLVKYAGAGYLLYLAWKTLRSGPLSFQCRPEQLSDAATFRRGFLMNVLNPKVALFFLAFLPQFAVPESGSLPLQMLLLGSVFMAQAVVIFSLIGYFAGSLGHFVASRPAVGRYLDLVTAGVFASLGARLALAER